MKSCVVFIFTIACFFTAKAQFINNHKTDIDNPFNKPYEWPDNQPEDCPFPESKEITKIVFTGRYANYTQADTWFPMWAADGNNYSPFTDGLVDGYMSIGHYTNMFEIYNNKNHRTGQAVRTGDDPYWVVNALYVRPHNDDNFFNEKGKAKFRVPRAVVYGQDNSLSPDGKIYLVSHGFSSGTGTNNRANGDALYLCRVDSGIENVIDHTKYEFWNGSSWAPTVEEARPFLDWPDNLGGATITWNPGLEKYILVVHHNNHTGIGDVAEEHRTIIMESDKITGPYKTIHYMVDWGPGSYFGNIPAKYISEDGKTAWLVISANCWAEPANPPQCIYSCSMHEFKFVTMDDE